MEFAAEEAVQAAVAVESPSVSDPAALDAAVEELETLVAPDGCSVQTADTCESAGRGLWATRALEEGHVLFRVPVECCVSPTNLRKWFQRREIVELYDATEEQFENALVPDMVRSVLMLLLVSSPDVPKTALCERWAHAYSKSLSRDFSYIPYHWDEHQVESLGPLLGPMVASMTSRLRGEVKDAHGHATRILAQWMRAEPNQFPPQLDHQLSLEWTAWVFLNFNSRAYNISEAEEGAGCERLAGLVPYSDFGNHGGSAEAVNVTITLQSREQGHCIEAVVRRTVQKGEQLCHAYQAKGDLVDFLFYYGFVPQSLDVSGEANAPTALHDAMSLYVNVHYTLTSSSNESKDNDNSGAGTILGNEMQRSSPQLAQALEALGFPVTPDLALPISVESPVPASWIWALRLQSMHEKGDTRALEGIAQRNSDFDAVHTQCALETARSTIFSAREWYSSAARRKGELQQLHTAACNILQSATDLLS